MAGTVAPKELPMAREPVEDERELLVKVTTGNNKNETTWRLLLDPASFFQGTAGVASAIAKQPILGSYLPVNPVNRYTFKKWDLNDWSRHNENKYFQANRDRDKAIT